MRSRKHDTPKTRRGRRLVLHRDANSRLGVPLASLVIALLAMVACSCGDSDSTGASGSHWVGSWSASPSDAANSGFNDQTLRMILTPHLAGSMLRVHLSNRFGSQPVTLDRVSIAQRQSGASLVPGSSRSLAFGGRPSVTLPASADVVSDPLRFTVVPFVDLAVSLYAPGVTGPATKHFTALQTSYVTGLTTGDRSADVDGAAFTVTTTSWYFIDGIDVMARSDVAAVVTFGDSITDGFQGLEGAIVPIEEGLDANERYPDFLQHRLLAAGRRLSVLNAGISGNRILHDGTVPPALGPSALSRLAIDAISQAGVTDVIILEGINDIGQAPRASATDIIAGLQQLVEQLHVARLNVLVGTLTPAGGAQAGFYGTAMANDTRQAVNTWIRSSGVADGVVDFDAALRDPQDPSRINPAYDGGDHLHFNSAGYEAMAGAVNLAALQGPPRAFGQSLIHE
jgi:lysophospholipase L1-like esterase